MKKITEILKSLFCVDYFTSLWNFISKNDAHYIISKKGFEILCEHKECDQYHQIRVIQCKECGQRAWLRDTKDLSKK